VVTGGAIAIDIGDVAVAYRNHVLTPLPAGSDDEAVWLPDYLGGYLERLARALLEVRPGRPTTAHLLDAPVALTFTQAGTRVVVRYWDAGQPVYRAVVPLAEARVTAATAIGVFLAALEQVNPRLADHPEVVDLQRQRDALAAAVDAPSAAFKAR
jgi:hypothetical protein